MSRRDAKRRLLAFETKVYNPAMKWIREWKTDDEYYDLLAPLHRELDQLHAIYHGMAIEGEERYRRFEYKDEHGRVWQVEMVPNRPIRCLDMRDCGRATEVHAAPDETPTWTNRVHMFIDEAEDPQVAVDAVLRAIDEVPRDPED